MRTPLKNSYPSWRWPQDIQIANQGGLLGLSTLVSEKKILDVKIDTILTNQKKIQMLKMEIVFLVNF